jgi:uncharacterized protein (TIGR02147 family)
MLFANETDYRSILRETVVSRKRFDSKINFQNLSKYMRVQKPYLSKILAGKADMNADQLFLAGEYLGFNEEEREYLGLCLELSRSVLEKRRQALFKKIKTLQNKYSKTVSHLETKKFVDPEKLQEYYLDPVTQIVHLCLSIKRYQENLPLIAKELKIGQDKVGHALNTLTRLKIIHPSEKIDNQYEIALKNIHLSEDSFLCNPNHALLRMMAIYQIQTESISPSKEKPYRLSVTFSADSEAFEILRSYFLDLVKKSEKIVDKAKLENVYQMSFDLFRWN